MRIKKLQNAGSIPEATITAYAPSINTAQGKSAAKNMASRLLSGQDNTGRVPVSYYNYITSELNGAIPTRQALNKTSEKILPYVVGSAFGPAGVVASLAGETVNTGVNAITKGKKDSWGDMFADEEKHPVWNTIADFTNPGYLFLGAIPKPSKATDVGVRMLNGETSKQILNDAIKDFGKNTKLIDSLAGQVKYYGPTMGKTTAVKTNPNLIDFDDIIRQPSKDILKKYGFTSKSDMYNSGNQEAIKEYEDMLVKMLQDWKANPNNSGFTLVTSPTAIANPEKTGFYFDNVPSIPSKETFIDRNVGRGGTPKASEMWYNSLMERNPNLRTDNRFVSEIEGNKVTSVPKQSPDYTQIATTYHYDPRIRIESKPISEAERLGIPKGERSNPKTLEDPQYWGYQQWNSRYNTAVNSGNLQEAQRLRDLHFKIKTSLDPKHYYHGTNARFTQFDENHIGTLDPGWYGRGFYFTPDRSIAEGYASAQIGPNIIYDSFLNVKNPIYRDAGIWDDTVVGAKIPEANDGIFVKLGEPEIVLDKSLQYDPNEIVEVVIPKANQIKLADPITRTDTGEIIPIVKRDNFHNPDIRHKQGGILKGQFGLSKLSPSAINESIDRFKQTKVGTTLNNFFNGTDSNLSDEEYIQKHGYAKPVGGIGILGAAVAPEWEGLEFPEITKYHYGMEAKIPKVKRMSRQVPKNLSNSSKQVNNIQIKSNYQKFLSKPENEMDDIVRYWNGENFKSFKELKRNEKALKQFIKWINKK